MTQTSMQGAKRWALRAAAIMAMAATTALPAAGQEHGSGPTSDHHIATLARSAGAGSDRWTDSARTALAASSSDKHPARWAILGLGIGAASGYAFAVHHCAHRSERNDCRRAFSLITIPAFGGAGAIAGAWLGSLRGDEEAVRCRSGHPRRPPSRPIWAARVSAFLCNWVLES